MSAQCYTRIHPRTSDVLPCLLRTCRGDPGHAPVLRREASVPRRHRVFPDGRLLRDVLRRRAHRRPRPRAHAHFSFEGCQRRRDSDVRRAVPRRRRLHCPARPEGIPGRRLRTGRGSQEGEGPRAPRSRSRRVSRNADRRRVSRGTGARVHDGHRACPAGARVRRGPARSLDRRVHGGGVPRRRWTTGAGRRARDPPTPRDRRARGLRRRGDARGRGQNHCASDLRRRVDFRSGVGAWNAARSAAGGEPPRVWSRGSARRRSGGRRARPPPARYAEGRPCARP